MISELGWESIEIAKKLNKRYLNDPKGWYGNWVINEDTKIMVNTYNSVFSKIEDDGRKLMYAMSCRPCIGKIVDFFFGVRKDGKCCKNIYGRRSKDANTHTGIVHKITVPFNSGIKVDIKYCLKK